MELFFGMVEDRNDPLELGRYRVRVFGIHTHDKIEIPTEALPWSSVLHPVTSAAANGAGQTPNLLVGSHVALTFLDEDMQKPLILGSVVGIAQRSHMEFNGQEVDPSSGQTTDPDANDPRGDQTNPPAVDPDATDPRGNQTNPPAVDPDATDPRGNQTNPPARPRITSDPRASGPR